MSTVKNINKLFDAIMAKDFLMQEFGSFVGESKANLVREGVKFTSSILNFIYYIKDEIAKVNEDKRAHEIINSRLKGSLDLAIDACRALEDGENWEEYDRLIELRGQVACEILDEMKAERN
ncbi:hypothetical protein F9Y90_04770 (plasmid) [Borrelia miyamotoi]|uniref:Uncharacterized protein n=3 Tax=Borrelia miyamotoi TaxID=47466 RepID=A0A482CZ61_9SPIR|nr:hypothetical protein [Borrelia miyamotoi]QBK65352.1 hypothetical protein EZU69_06705 [Borrelia miyamotoi]QBL99213.1 hypothetical protein EZU71_04870 [Borrelia miyamotoi]QFP42429.1 hypothetical protein F9Y90_04770 [Borrelia miyamotoi]WAZ72435.1 hypothetical protein O5404_05275 [Borrelia miyamotoi]WAZ72868.1 hypothetical protein O5404_07595 [Borrelia miyamotoi]